MNFGEEEITPCPHCAKLYKKRAIVSYNTFGATIFSDGHVDGMIPNFVSIIKCSNETCSKFFDLVEQEAIGEISKDEFGKTNNEEWVNATEITNYVIETKSLEDALKTDFIKNVKNEIKVRTLLLRRYNNKFRENRKNTFSEQELILFTSNAKRLIELLKNSFTTNELLFLAELQREIGDFDASINTICNIKNENTNEKVIKEKVFSQAKLKDSIVFNVNMVAIKMEYQCISCNHTLVLFDLEKINNTLDYKHYRCKDENIIFSAASKSRNQNEFYKLNLFQKTFKTKIPYQEILINKEIYCPNCNKSETELFNPEKDKCISCKEGHYIKVKWF